VKECGIKLTFIFKHKNLNKLGSVKCTTTIKSKQDSTRYISQVIRQDINNLKLEGYHKEINSGIEITEGRGDDDVSRCSLTRK
jgi:hypothetical protein